MKIDYHYHEDMKIPKNDGSWIFVFGSNQLGVHGAGSARVAQRVFGAKRGVGQGITGNAYAIPTKNTRIQTLPLDDISNEVILWMSYATHRKDKRFWMTRIGCGLAGYTDEQIAPMFRCSPSNVSFPLNWKPFLEVDCDESIDFKITKTDSYQF